MTAENHMAALQRRHRELERQIANEMTHKSYNDLLVASLKRRKLEVKDELEKLRRSAA